MSITWKEAVNKTQRKKVLKISKTPLENLGKFINFACFSFNFPYFWVQKSQELISRAKYLWIFSLVLALVKAVHQIINLGFQFHGKDEKNKADLVMDIFWAVLFINHALASLAQIPKMKNFPFGFTLIFNYFATA
ncbi:unnamed protein product, partial [Allacma fusca]